MWSVVTNCDSSVHDPRGITASLIGTSNHVNGWREMYIRSRLKSYKSKPVLKKMSCLRNRLFKVVCVSAPVARTRKILGYLRFKRSIWYIHVYDGLHTTDTTSTF